MDYWRGNKVGLVRMVTLLLFGDTLKRTFNAFALSGRDCSNTWDPGCRYACPGLRAPLGLQPALVSRVLLVVIGRYLL